MDDFVDAVLEAPLGVTLLARIETCLGSTDPRPLESAAEAAAVRIATERMAELSFGEFVEMAVLVGELYAGPWVPYAASTVAAAYRNAAARAPIAEAISSRFGAELHAPIDRRAQQWWTAGDHLGPPAKPEPDSPLFTDFENVYDAGQFTWAGRWTVTDPPDVTHLQLIDAWEMQPNPITRWWLRANDNARVCEIHRPADWARLVREHPTTAADNGEHWELPSRNQKRSEVADLMTVPGQRAARTDMARHLVPDWRSVADRYDGVHLSWAGLITSEGCIVDHGDDTVTMLRYWFSERTHWLADVFEGPELASPPMLDDPDD